MAKTETEATVTQSILDRLIDLEPREIGDPQFSRAFSVRQYKAGVRRDLQWLLNTKRTPFQAGVELEHTHKSLYNYGIPDFSVLTVNSNRDRNRLLGEMEEAIQFFEPRLRNVKVTLANLDGLTTKRLRFQIEATLMMDPSPEQVSFDTVLDVISGDYEVKGERGA
jgi:type VI secretion system protein ImpF